MPDRFPDAARPAERLDIELPAIRSIARHAVPNIIEGVVLPTIVFYVGLAFGSVSTALVATTVASYAILGRRVLRGRRIGGLLMVTAVTLTFRLALALASGNVSLYFLQPIGAKLVVALAFLGSMRTAVPLLQRLAGDFIELPAALTNEAPIRRFFVLASVGWAAVLILHSAVAAWLLFTQPIEIYVLVKTGLNVLFKGGAIVVTFLVFRTVAQRNGIQVGFAVPAGANALELA